MIDLHDHFRWVADLLDEERRDDETALLWYAAERGDFARLNRTRVRQAGHVEQRRASVRLVIGRCHALATVDLAGHVDTDRPRLRETLAVLRTHLAFAEPDPHLLFGETPSVGKDQRRGRLPATGDALREIITQADGLDLVGVWACGEIARGHASTLGTRRWHSRDHWLFDWSVHAGNDVAVKNSLAGEHWAPEPLAVALRDDRQRLALLSKRARTPPPGRYRALIAPAALAELRRLDMVTLSASGEPTGAYPFTTRDTGHVVHVDAHAVNAMCALDALAVEAVAHVRHLDDDPAVHPGLDADRRAPVLLRVGDHLVEGQHEVAWPVEGAQGCEELIEARAREPHERELAESERARDRDPDPLDAR